MEKMDIERAYRNIPVAPSNQKLLGLEWQSQAYVDKVLPFSLHSAPLVFSTVADALLWITKWRGISRAIYYIGDFLNIGVPNFHKCQ